MIALIPTLITVYPDRVTVVDTGSLIGCEGLTIDENMKYMLKNSSIIMIPIWRTPQMLMVISLLILTTLMTPENISNIIPPTYSMTQDGDTVIVILTTLNNHGSRTRHRLRTSCYYC